MTKIDISYLIVFLLPGLSFIGFSAWYFGVDVSVRFNNVIAFAILITASFIINAILIMIGELLEKVLDKIYIDRDLKKELFEKDRYGQKALSLAISNGLIDSLPSPNEARSYDYLFMLIKTKVYAGSYVKNPYWFSSLGQFYTTLTAAFLIMVLMMIVAVGMPDISIINPQVRSMSRMVGIVTILGLFFCRYNSKRLWKNWYLEIAKMYTVQNTTSAR